MPAAFIAQPTPPVNPNLVNQVGHPFLAANFPQALSIDAAGDFVLADSDDAAILATHVGVSVLDVDNFLLAAENEIVTVAGASFTPGDPVGCSSTTPGAFESFTQMGATAGAISSNVLGYAVTATTFRYGKERAIGL